MSPAIGAKPGRHIHALPAFFAGQVVASLLVTVCLLGASRFLGRPVHQVDLFSVCMLGISFSQVTVLAAWNAWGDSQHFLRPMGSVTCLVVIWLIWFGIPDQVDEIPWGIALPGIAMFVQWVFVQIPLWFVRLSFGWQMGLIEPQGESGNRSAVQFGIKHLLIWTTLVGTVFGIAKIFLRTSGLNSHDGIQYGLFLICNSLFAWPTLLSCLSNRWLPMLLLAAGGFFIVVTSAEPYLFFAVSGSRVEHSLFWCVNTIQFIWIAGSMLILRRFGFRLVRPRKQA